MSRTGQWLLLTAACLGVAAGWWAAFHFSPRPWVAWVVSVPVASIPAWVAIADAVRRRRRWHDSQKRAVVSLTEHMLTKEQTKARLAIMGPSGATLHTPLRSAVIEAAKAYRAEWDRFTLGGKGDWNYTLGVQRGLLMDALEALEAAERGE